MGMNLCTEQQQLLANQELYIMRKASITQIMIQVIL